MAPSLDSKALRQALNERTGKYFAVAMVSIMGLFILSHWTSFLYHRYSRRRSGPVRLAAVRFSRRARAVLRIRFVDRISLGRVLLYIVYWGINLILACTSVLLSELVNVAKHLGWVAVCNLALVIFLSLKNTPLAILSASSYEVLLPLHKVSGYTCIVAVWVHAIVYLNAWAQAGTLRDILEVNQIAGIMGGISVLLIGLSTFPYIRRHHYELFYIIHIVLSVFILIVVGLHRPDFTKSVIMLTLSVASIFVLDRAISFAKFTWNFTSNYATLTALPNGATRVSLRRSMKATPGSHAFLWLPSIRFAETHPFTLVCTDPIEFVVRARNGFTSDLYQYAQKSQGAMLKCSLNGGYGQPPDFQSYDSVLLIAGGSGASFTFAVALDLSRDPGPRPPSNITFIWVVREHASLEWFNKELREILLEQRIRVVVHVTNDTASARATPPLASSKEDSATISDVPSESSTPIDPEKATEYAVADISDTTVRANPGRPDIRGLMQAFVANEDPTNRVVIGACGPRSLLDTARAAASECMRTDGPSIILHTEEFSW